MTARSSSLDWLGQPSLDSRRFLLALAALYSLAWLLLLPASHLLWFLPAGFRLGALWLTPTRRWPWLAAGEWLALGGLLALDGGPPVRVAAVLALFAPFLIYAAVVRLMRGPEPRTPIDDPRGMLRLLGSGMFSAALVSPVLQLTLSSPQSGDVAAVFTYLYGDFLGQLVVAPLLVLALSPPLRRQLGASLYLDICLQLLFSLTVFWLVRQRHDLAPYILLLAFAPIFFVAFRQGWQGAAISVALLGLISEGMLRLGLVPLDVRVMQLALAVVGGGGLVLGAASSALRRSHERLAGRHRELAQVNRSLTEAAGELRSVSQRLVRLEEQGERELAVELDYELGRSIHALSTRISLAFRDVRDDQMLRLLESIREQVREMQDSLRRVLRQLRPQVLDTHGLREAVGFGPLRDMLEDAGIAYEAVFHGQVEALNDDARTTVYRICQATVREASRSESIRRLVARIDVSAGDTRRLEVDIQIDIEASPFLEFPIEPNPLAAITDRVLAQQGSYWVEPLSPGVRHRIRFEQDAATLL